MNALRDTPLARRRFVGAALLVGLLGLALRALYVATAQIDGLVFGDGLQYLVYAMNLLHHGVFSCTPPGAGEIVADSYRAPGFPLLLAAGQALAGDNVELGVRYAQYMQVVISSASVLVSIALARLWLPRGAALLAGLVVACWPHLITFAATIMSETLFGFWLVLGTWLLCLGERRARAWILAGAGAAFSCAYLANPIIVFFPPLAGVLLLRRGKGRLAAAFVAAALLAPLGWSWRNSHLSTDVSQFHHAVDGFVWGSSPVYIPAFNSRWVSPEAKRIVDFEEQETQQILADPVAGLGAVLERMRQDPLAYLSWYVLEKPWLLWDWTIVVGNGDIYYPKTTSSPLERITVLHWMKQLLKFLNPLLSALALGGGFYYAARELRRPRQTQFAPGVIALFFLYVTAWHALLLALPRYAIAYRPEQIVLAIGSAAGLLAWLRQRRRGSAPAAAA